MSASEFQTKEAAIAAKLGQLGGVPADRVSVSVVPSASAALLLQTHQGTLDIRVSIRDGAGGVSSQAAAAELLSMSPADLTSALGVSVLSVNNAALPPPLTPSAAGATTS